MRIYRSSPVLSPYQHLFYQCLFLIVFSLAGPFSRRPAHADDEFLKQLAKLDINGLMAQEVYSVLRKEQPVLTSPSAVFVLTNEDIRRSGARNIPEALRQVPGVLVARTNSSTWSISIRGVDSDGSAKLLVLIDGRSVYSPFFTGVFWDVQDLMLEDVDRIEVIRGPGAVSWGENAVNGVINIITKSASKTTGGLVAAGGGKEEQGFGAVRYGDKVGENTSYRVYTKYDLHDSFDLTTGDDADDQWQTARGGFRIDSDVNSSDLLTLQGDLYGGDSGRTLTRWTEDLPPFGVTKKYDNDLGGGNVMARWNRKVSETSNIKLQTYYDRTERSIEATGSENRDTYDIDFQHQFLASEAHTFVWGTNVRVTSAELGSSRSLMFDTPTHTDSLANMFVQDDITVLPNLLRIIPGTKLGYNDFTGFEAQPSIRFVYTPTNHDALWGAVSRAVRTPALIDTVTRINAIPTVSESGDPQIFSVFRNEDFHSEDLLAYELGYRSQISPTFSYDIATFFHHYNNLLSLEPGSSFAETTPSPPHLVNPLYIDNNLNGQTYGTEIYTSWQALDYLSLGGSYSLTFVDYYGDSDSSDSFSATVDQRNPRHLANFRAHLELPSNWEVDSTLYYVDSLKAFDIGSHIRSDVQVGWRPLDDLLLNIVAQDIFDNKHREFGNTNSVEVQRAIFGKITYKFQ